MQMEKEPFLPSFLLAGGKRLAQHTGFSGSRTFWSCLPTAVGRTMQWEDSSRRF